MLGRRVFLKLTGIGVLFGLLKGIDDVVDFTTRTKTTPHQRKCDFVLILPEIRRSLRCPECRHEALLRAIATDKRYKYSWSNYTFRATCVGCGYQGDWAAPIDHPTGEVFIHRPNVHEIQIKSDDFTGDRAYIWVIPADYRSKIACGNIFDLERANWDVIQAVKKGMNFRYEDGVIRECA